MALFWAWTIYLRGLHGRPQNVEQYVRSVQETSSRGVERAAEHLDQFISDLEKAAASGNHEAQGFLGTLAAKDLI